MEHRAGLCPSLYLVLVFTLEEDGLEERVNAELLVDLHWQCTSAAPGGQVGRHVSAESDRRVDDRSGSARQRCCLAVISELVLLVPVDVRRPERFEGKEGHELAADATVHVEDDIRVPCDVRPDLLATLHAVDAADYDPLQRHLSGEVFLVDLDAFGAELQEILLYPLHLRAHEVLGPHDQVGGDVPWLDDIGVEEDEPLKPHCEQRRQDGGTDASSADDVDGLCHPVGVEETSLVAEVGFELKTLGESHSGHDGTFLWEVGTTCGA